MSSLFGLDQSDRLVFVSEAPRGLACHCRCVVCNEPLIARQGTVRDHHFAHASGTDPCCANHESLLHRYAKRLIQAAGHVTVRVITYDPDVVSMVRTIAKANHARYAPKWKSWNVPRWRAEAVRQELRARSKSVAIVMTSKP